MRSHDSIPSSACTHGSKTSIRHNGPSVLPCRGVSSRELHGVRIVPTNTRPASVADGGSTATSAARISPSQTIHSGSCHATLPINGMTPMRCDSLAACCGR